MSSSWKRGFAFAIAGAVQLQSTFASLPDLEVAAHHVKLWNLVGPCHVDSSIPGQEEVECAYITNPLLSAAISASCTKTHIIWEGLGGCPNIASFSASDVDFNITGESLGGDMLATVLSTIGIPATVVSYFEATARVNMSINGTRNVKNGTSWLPDYWHRGSSFDFKAAVDLKLNAFAEAVAFPSIIEWEDVKGDGKFDPLHSKPVSVYNLAEHELFREGSYFLPMSTSVTRKRVKSMINGAAAPAEGALVYKLSAKTVDGIFTISFETSNVAHVGEDGEMRSPNSAKISVEINNFPFKKNNTKLALQTVALNANAGSQIDVSTDGNHMTMDGSKAQGVFAWKESATSVSAGGVHAIPVKANVITNSTEIKSLALSAASAVMFSGISYDARIVYFTFDAVNPSKIIWDPELAVRSSSEDSEPLTGLETALLIIGGAALIAGVGFLVWRAYRIRQQRQRLHEGYRALLSAYELE